MFEVLSINNLRNLWLGQVLSLIGTRMFSIALSWWILSQNSSGGGLKIGLLLITGALPSILFAKKLGLLIDRSSLKKLVIVTDLMAALISLLLSLWVTFIGTPSLPFIYIACFLLAFSGAIIDPTMNKMVSILSPRELLEKSTSLISSTSAISFLIGAMVGALTIDAFGLQGSLWINTTSYFLAVFFSLKMKLPKEESSIPPIKNSELIEGTKTLFYLPKDPILKGLLLSFGLVNFFSAPLFITLPLFVKKIIHGSGSLLAFLEGAIYAGMVIGTFGAVFIGKRTHPLLVGALSILFMGLFILFIGGTTNVWLAGFLVLLAASSISIGNVKFMGFFQRHVPENEKGQFFASLSGLANLTYPLAFFLFGWLSDYILVNNLYLIQGLGVITLSVRFFYLSRKGSSL